MQDTMLGSLKDCVPSWESALEEASTEVFSMMLNSEISLLERAAHPENEVTALIGLAGPVCGTFRVRCGYGTARRMTAAMLGSALEAIKDETLDGLGEICNLLAGAFKAKLGKGKDSCVLSVPTVVSGSDYLVRPLADCESLERVFGFEGEPLWIAVDIKACCLN